MLAHSVMELNAGLGVATNLAAYDTNRLPAEGGADFARSPPWPDPFQTHQGLLRRLCQQRL